MKHLDIDSPQDIHVGRVEIYNNFVVRPILYVSIIIQVRNSYGSWWKLDVQWTMLPLNNASV